MTKFLRLRETWRGAQWLYLGLGTCAAAGGQSLVVWMLARTAEPQLVGTYGLAIAWLAPLFAFCNLQLRPLLATENAVFVRLRAYQLLRWTGMGTALVLAGCAAWAGRHQEGFAFVLLGAALPRLAEMMSDFSYGLRTRQAKFRAVGMSQALRALVSFGVFGVVWTKSGNLPAALVGGGVSAWAITLWLDKGALSVVNGERGGREWTLAGSLVAVGQIVRVALPLAAVVFLNQAVVASPRLLLGYWLDWDDLAVLSCLMSLLVLPSLLATSYAAGLSQQLAERFGQAGIAGMWPVMRTASQSILVAAAPSALALVSFGGEGMRWIFGSAYTVDRPALCGAAIFAVTWALASVFGTAATAARRIAPQVTAFSLALVTCVMLGYVLIPRVGLAGATLSLGGAGVVIVATYLIEFHWSMARLARTPLPRSTVMRPEEGIADA
ncbi:MAG: lipopolysaccharide biosynthesis protein [Bryobacterales bacterium]|nr:lipopolysaccharide biosynthesis protein [Bryobacterales bacterium]